MPLDAVRTTVPHADDSRSSTALLRSFVQAYWLRPENAVWMALRSSALTACELRSPSLDLCCGDGVFSFIHNGGRFTPEFDVFRTTDHLGKVSHEHADMFDAFDSTYQPEVSVRPMQSISVGTDHKTSLLDKARRLNLYNDLLHHDANAPMPFANGTFRSVYCNSAYWMTELDFLLSELHRITAQDGIIVLHAKLDAIRTFTLDHHERRLGREFLDIIGRGRFDTWPSLLGRPEWESRIHNAGLSISHELPFATGAHAQMWDIGLRPVAPLLVRMANTIDSSSRAAIKRDWVELMMTLLTPMFDPTFALSPDQAEPVEIQYILRKI
ncbi:MAG: methyltransferase domain-containing protein [Planctomycetota bacterium]|jgi:SAM-dependent methyltransferase